MSTIKQNQEKRVNKRTANKNISQSAKLEFERKSERPHRYTDDLQGIREQKTMKALSRDHNKTLVLA